MNEVKETIASIIKSFECAICWDLLADPVSTGCYHYFCRTCIQKVLTKKYRAPCPLCKKPFTKRSLQERPQLQSITAAAKNLAESYSLDTGLEVTPPRGPKISTLSPGTKELEIKLFNINHPSPLKPKLDKPNGPSKDKKICARRRKTNFKKCAKGNGSGVNKQALQELSNTIGKTPSLRTLNKVNKKIDPNTGSYNSDKEIQDFLKLPAENVFDGISKCDELNHNATSVLPALQNSLSKACQKQKRTGTDDITFFEKMGDEVFFSTVSDRSSIKSPVFWHTPKAKTSTHTKVRLCPKQTCKDSDSESETVDKIQEWLQNCPSIASDNVTDFNKDIDLPEQPFADVIEIDSKLEDLPNQCQTIAFKTLPTCSRLGTGKYFSALTNSDENANFSENLSRQPNSILNNKPQYWKTDAVENNDGCDPYIFISSQKTPLKVKIKRKERRKPMISQASIKKKRVTKNSGFHTKNPSSEKQFLHTASSGSKISPIYHGTSQDTLVNNDIQPTLNALENTKSTELVTEDESNDIMLFLTPAFSADDLKINNADASSNKLSLKKLRLKSAKNIGRKSETDLKRSSSKNRIDNTLAEEEITSLNDEIEKAEMYELSVQEKNCVVEIPIINALTDETTGLRPKKLFQDEDSSIISCENCGPETYVPDKTGGNIEKSNFYISATPNNQLINLKDNREQLTEYVKSPEATYAHSAVNDSTNIEITSNLNALKHKEDLSLEQIQNEGNSEQSNVGMTVLHPDVGIRNNSHEVNMDQDTDSHTYFEDDQFSVEISIKDMEKYFKKPTRKTFALDVETQELEALSNGNCPNTLDMINGLYTALDREVKDTVDETFPSICDRSNVDMALDSETTEKIRMDHDVSHSNADQIQGFINSGQSLSVEIEVDCSINHQVSVPDANVSSSPALINATTMPSKNVNINKCGETRDSYPHSEFTQVGNSQESTTPVDISKSGYKLSSVCEDTTPNRGVLQTDASPRTSSQVLKTSLRNDLELKSVEDLPSKPLNCSVNSAEKMKVVKRVCLTLEEINSYFEKSYQSDQTEVICTLPSPSNEFRIMLSVSDQTLNVSVLKSVSLSNSNKDSTMSFNQSVVNSEMTGKSKENTQSQCFSPLCSSSNDNYNKDYGFTNIPKPLECTNQPSLVKSNDNDGSHCFHSCLPGEVCVENGDQTSNECISPNRGDFNSFVSDQKVPSTNTKHNPPVSKSFPVAHLPIVINENIDLSPKTQDACKDNVVGSSAVKILRNDCDTEEKSSMLNLNMEGSCCTLMNNGCENGELVHASLLQKMQNSPFNELVITKDIQEVVEVSKDDLPGSMKDNTSEEQCVMLSDLNIPDMCRETMIPHNTTKAKDPKFHNEKGTNKHINEMNTEKPTELAKRTNADSEDDQSSQDCVSTDEEDPFLYRDRPFNSSTCNTQLKFDDIIQDCEGDSSDPAMIFATSLVAPLMEMGKKLNAGKMNDSIIKSGQTSFQPRITSTQASKDINSQPESQDCLQRKRIKLYKNYKRTSGIKRTTPVNLGEVHLPNIFSKAKEVLSPIQEDSRESIDHTSNLHTKKLSSSASQNCKKPKRVRRLDSSDESDGESSDNFRKNKFKRRLTSIMGGRSCNSHQMIDLNNELNEEGNNMGIGDDIPMDKVITSIEDDLQLVEPDSQTVGDPFPLQITQNSSIGPSGNDVSSSCPWTCDEMPETQARGQIKLEIEEMKERIKMMEEQINKTACASSKPEELCIRNVTFEEIGMNNSEESHVLMEAQSTVLCNAKEQMNIALQKEILLSSSDEESEDLFTPPISPTPPKRCTGNSKLSLFYNLG